MPGDSQAVTGDHASCCSDCAAARTHLTAQSTVSALRERLDQFGLSFAAISYEAAVRARDAEACEMWAWEMVEAAGVLDLSDEEKQAVVDRHFADLIINVGVGARERDHAQRGEPCCAHETSDGRSPHCWACDERASRKSS